MASFLEKIRLKTAERPKRKFDLSCTHLTSQNFNNLSPIYYRMMIPNSDIRVDASSYARFEPMPQPTFMTCDIHTRAFFVPFHTIYRPFDDFQQNMVHNSGEQSDMVITEVPCFTARDFHAYIMNHVLQSEQIVDDPYNGMSYNDLFTIDQTDKLLYQLPAQTDNLSPADCEKVNQYCSTADVIIPHPDNSGRTANEPTYLRFTARGRYIFKVLESLGYRFDWLSYGLENNSYLDTQFSSLNLLAYCRVIFDWYYPSQYAKATELYNKMESYFNRDFWYTFTSAMFDNIFDFICTYILPSDYFTSAFDNANAPNSASQSINFIRFSDQTNKDSYNPSSNVNSVVTDGMITPEAQVYDVDSHIPVSAGATSPWAVEMLSRLGAYMRRNQMSGAKLLDRYLAKYGIQLPNEVQNRSQYLGSDDYDVRFFDVTATNATDTDSLGQFAGKGNAASSHEFSYSADKFGLFIILNDVTPRINYTQGCDRSNLYTKIFDFYSADFDMVGMQSVRKFELIAPRSSVDFGIDSNLFINSQTSNPQEIDGFLNEFSGFGNQHFGFLPRYSEYKTPRSWVTGNFSNPGVNSGNTSWIDTRFFSLLQDNKRNSHWWHPELQALRTYSSNFNDFIHSLDFCSDLGDQYLRLFYNVVNEQDNVLMQHYFKVDYNAPMASLYDMFDFENQKYGKEIKLDVSGSRV